MVFRESKEGEILKIHWLKLLGLIILDIFIIGLVREIGFNSDFNIPSLILESLHYNFTHLSFVGLVGALGMLLLSVGLILVFVSFITFNWIQFKSCFSKRKN